MSHITDVVIFMPYLPKDVEAMLLKGYEDDSDSRMSRIVSFKQIDEQRGGYLFTGGKVFCSHLFGGAFNYLDQEQFEKWIIEVIGRCTAVVIIDPEEWPLKILHLNAETDRDYR